MDKSLPLSAPQHGIWLGQNLNPASPLYNAAECLEITGKLDITLFEQALRKVNCAASVLHMRVNEADEQQLAPAEWELSLIDLTYCEDPFAQSQKQIRSDLNTVVNLKTGPVFRQMLFQLGEDHFLWYQRIHHIACDGYAFALLANKVAEVYQKLTEGAALSEPLFGDYHAVIAEDARYQDSDKRNKDKNFWQGALQKIHPPKPLKPLQPMQHFARHTQTSIARSVFENLKKCANGAWPDALYALCTHWLASKTGAEHITLGVPVMARMGTPAVRVPAMVMNINPLPVNVSGCKTFADILERVQDFQKIARRHQRYRYEHLRRDVGAVGGTRRLFGPVVNVMPFERTLNFAGSTVKVHPISAGPVEDISITFSLNTDGALNLRIEANSNAYSQCAVNQYEQELLALLQKVVVDTATPLTLQTQALSWLEGPDLGSPGQPAVQQIFAQAQAWPEKPALVDGETVLTYRSLARRVTQLALQIATRLQAEGAPPQDGIIALAMERSAQAVLTSLAVLASGNAYVFIDPKGPATRNKTVLEDANPTLLITDQKISETLSTSQSCITLDALEKVVVAATQLPVVSAEQTAYLIYTSGSTGKPKGVKIGQAALADFIQSAQSEYGIQTSDRILQFAPLHFDASVEEIYLALCSGGTLVLRNEAMLGSIAEFLSTCQAWQISVLDLPTAFWHELVLYCANTQTPLPFCVHTVIIGGEAAQAERVAQWHAMLADQCVEHNIQLLNTYGPSEATVVATCAKLSPHSALSIGRPLPGRQVAVVDEHGAIVPKGEEGELVILGRGLGQGYHNLPALTAECFAPMQRFYWCDHPVAYRSGDRVRINAQDNVEFIGRVDDEVKISGHRIHPLEVEAALLALPEIAQASVVVDSRSGRPVLQAFVVSSQPLKNHGEPGKAIRAILQQTLPAPMVPAAVTCVPQLPKTPAGKVDKKALLAKCFSPSEITPAPNSAQNTIAAVWREVLNITDIKAEDDFFLLGGQSLQTIQVANRLSVLFAQEVPVTLLFECPTLAQLADALEGKQTTGKVDLAQQIQTDAELPEARTALWQKNLAAKTRKEKPATILLTGATGFVGAQILHNLLSGGSHVICLVRASSVEQGTARLQKAFNQQRLPLSQLNAKDNLTVLVGDAGKPKMGLAATVWQVLSKQVNAVIHNAANTSVMRDYQSLRNANLDSTHHLMQLAAEAGAALHLVSTIAVTQGKNAGGLPEDFVAYHTGLKDGYQKSKWASEYLLAQAAEQNLPVAIYRLGRVTGALDTGYVNPQDLAWRMIRASLMTGHYPQTPLQEPWAPVDILAHAISHGVQQQKTGVYNLVPQQQVALQQVFGWVKQCGLSLKAAEFSDWLTHLKNHPDEACQTLHGFFVQRKAATQSTENTDGESAEDFSLPPITTQRGEALLSHSGKAFSALTFKQFTRYVDFALTHQLIPQPDASEAPDECTA